MTGPAHAARRGRASSSGVMRSYDRATDGIPNKARVKAVMASFGLIVPRKDATGRIVDRTGAHAQPWMCRGFA